MDWLLDLGTVNTRATQFVRTQAESWHMKTLLAKALSMQGEYAEQLRRLQNISEAKTEEHMAILESIEFKMSALDQQVDTINKKLTVMIKLLRHVIGQDIRQAKIQKDESVGDQQGNHPKPGQTSISRSEPVSETSKHYVAL